MGTLSLSLAVVLGVLALSNAALRASLSANGGGLTFAVPDEDGTTLVAVHYSVNKPVPGVKAGDWNFDIRSKSGDQWVHQNANVRVNNGDVIHYWLYRIRYGRAEQLTDQRWTVTSGSGSNTGSNTGGTPVSTGSSAGDQTWNGRKLRLIFDDNFSNAGVDASKWVHEVTLSGGGNSEFQAYTNLPDNTFTRNGALFIKPTLTADKYGESFLTSGVWDLNRYYGVCTDGNFGGCKREGRSGLLNPTMSGKLKSKSSIRYGKVEISAKMPRGDWLWPALWMLPSDNGLGGSGAYGGWPKSGEIDIMESRGNRNYGNLGVDYMGSTLHWGTDYRNNRYTMTMKHKKCTKCSLADGYHKYTLYWDQNGMDFYLDDEHITRFATPSQGFFRWGNLPGNNIWSHANNAPFDKPFYLIMNVAVGGKNGFFPDGVPNGSGAKPWSNGDGNAPEKFWRAKNQWYPTWNGDDATMQVDYVRMWQLE